MNCVFRTRRVLKFNLVARNYNDIPFEDIPEVSPAVIKKTLNNRKLNFNDGFTCFIILCPLCSSQSTKKSKSIVPNLYINKTTGNFFFSVI